jgi:putative FmdB family regulatory protein
LHGVAGFAMMRPAVPTYDYQCRSCGAVTEVIHSMLEDGPSSCERCGGDVRRVLYPTGIIFKGSGFYRTDSRSTTSSSPPSGSGEKKESTESGSAEASTPATDAAAS